MAHVHEIIGSLRALTYLDPYGLSAKAGSVMYISRAKTDREKSLQKVELSFERQSPFRKRPKARTHRNVTEYSKQIIRTFEEQSFGQMLSTINTYALARRSSNSESQLTSLWSSVEVLLGDPPRGQPRIIYYAKLLVPCVCLRHVRRQTIAVYDEMLVSYRRKFARLVSEDRLSPAPDQHTKFASVLYMKENEDLRTELCKLCEKNPLALHRLWKLHRDFSSPQKITDAINGHENRVFWQICRIYRARNRVVHIGDTPSIMDSLVLNAAEYYTAAIATVINRAKQQTEPASLEQVVAEIGIEYQLYKRHFESRKSEPQLSQADLAKLVVSKH